MTYPFFTMLPRPPSSTLFPYTTLFRSDTVAVWFRPTPSTATGMAAGLQLALLGAGHLMGDRKSTRLNSSHRCISYAVFCLKKKKNTRRASTYDISFCNSYARLYVILLS